METPQPAPVAPPPAPRDAAERAARRARLRTPLAELPRVHPAPRALLEERGHLTVEQALAFWPRDYQDRSRRSPIAELRTGEPGVAVGTVRAVKPARMRSGQPLLHVELEDPSGRLDLVFFNPPAWRMRQFARGETLLVSGQVTEGFGGRKQMRQPEVEKLTQGDSANFGRVVPRLPRPGRPPAPVPAQAHEAAVRRGRAAASSDDAPRRGAGAPRAPAGGAGR